MKVLAVIPAYNEQTTIGSVISEVKKYVDDVVVVNDGSADQTQTLAEAAGALVISHAINRGQGAALQTGISYALSHQAEVIVTFDADGQHQASEIPLLIEPIKNGEVEIVLGSRFLNKKSEVPVFKKIVLLLAVWFSKLYTGLKISDVHNGFRALSVVAAQKIKIKQDGMAHASEIIEQVRILGLKYREMPVTITYTDYSKQKGQKLTNSFRIILDLILARLSR